MKTYHPVAEDYYVVKESSLSKLMIEVKSKITQHWAPQGAVTVNGEEYLQAMVYWERSEEDKLKSKKEADEIAHKMWGSFAENLPAEALDEALNSKES